MNYVGIDVKSHTDYVEIDFSEETIVLKREDARKLGKDLWYEFGEISWT